MILVSGDRGHLVVCPVRKDQKVIGSVSGDSATLLAWSGPVAKLLSGDFLSFTICEELNYCFIPTAMMYIIIYYEISKSYWVTFEKIARQW